MHLYFTIIRQIAYRFLTRSKLYDNMCRISWIKEMLYKAHCCLEIGDLDSLADIIIVLDEKKIDERDLFTFSVEGYSKSSISKSEYYFNIGSLLAAYPERENEALESFCMYNYYQLQKKEGVELKETKTYYSFRRANEYSYADLAKDTITLVSPKLMNDPLDTLMFPWIKARTLHYRKLLQKADITENYKQILKNMERLFIESQNYYKIRSFCAWKKDDGEPPYQNTLMWSHYADSHKGFCVVYKLSPEMRFKKDKASYWTMKRMNYFSKPLDLTEIKDFGGEMALLAKSSYWEYEKEFRLLMYDPSKKDEYYPLELDKDSYVYAVIFGMKCNDATKSIIRSVLRGKQVKYYEMSEDLQNIYSLKLHEITKQ